MYNEIVALLNEELEEDLLKDITNIDQDDELIEYGLDSLNLVKVILAIEERYNIEFSEEELEFENFSTLKRIINIIEKKRGDISDDE